MLFNLLGKTLIENSIGALKHHIKKKEVVRNLEIDAAKEIQLEKLKFCKIKILIQIKLQQT